MTTHYEALEVGQDATLVDIRKQFQTLSLLCHPDKYAGPDPAAAVEMFDKVAKAWSVLGNIDTRAAYDAELQAKGMTSAMPVQEEVDLDDMNENEDAATWSWDCRCGGQYIVSEKDLEAECEYYGCNSCTLCIRVLYEAAEESDADDVDDVGATSGNS
eukprot:gene12221-30096_t